MWRESSSRLRSISLLVRGPLVESSRRTTGNRNVLDVGSDTAEQREPQQGYERPVVFDPQSRPMATLDESVKGALLRGERVGKARLPCIYPSEKVTYALKKILNKPSHKEVKSKVPQYLVAGVKLRNHLHNRQLPVEEGERWQMVKEEMVEVAKSYVDILSNKTLTEQQTEDVRSEIEGKATKTVNTAVRGRKWMPVNYDETASYGYLLGKAPYDYATVHTALSEIKNRMPDFQPRTLFDYGSGVGTTIWATQELFGTMTEIFAVDTSPDMNSLARLILLEGKDAHSLPAGTFFRMTLPTSNTLLYDLVTCCHTLLELPSREARLVAVDTLWRKTEHGGFFVLVEDGTNAGFEVLAEARDYLLQLSSLKLEFHETNEDVEGSLFAPCPHSGRCPRYFQDKVPCNFDVRYKTFQLREIPQEIRDLANVHRYAYLIFRKVHFHEPDKSVKVKRFSIKLVPLDSVQAHPAAKRRLWAVLVDTTFDSDDSSDSSVLVKPVLQARKAFTGKAPSEDSSFPRLLYKPMKNKKKFTCRMCTSREKLEEILIQKDGWDPDEKLTYQYVSRLQIGDQVKVHLSDRTEPKPSWRRSKMLEKAARAKEQNSERENEDD